MKKIFILFLSFFLISISNAQIRVACIGNSITYGHGLKRDETYPAQLQKILGTAWDIQNFGVSGRTLLTHGDFPYIKEKAYENAKAFAPDVVIIMLGTNDAKPQNWKFSEEFIADYTSMISELSSLPSKPLIIICLPVHAYGINFSINDSIVNNEVVSLVGTIAKKNGVTLVDLQKPLANHPEWFPDKIHPDKDGAREMARVLSKKLLKLKKTITRNKNKIVVEAGAPSDQQRQAITFLIDQYSAAREKSDTTLLKNILTEDVDQLVSTGEWRNGIGAAVQGMMRSSGNNPGTRTLRIENIRMLSPTTAVVDCRYEIQNTDGSVRKMWSTFIVVEENKTWKIAAIRNMLPTGP